MLTEKEKASRDDVDTHPPESYVSGGENVDSLMAEISNLRSEINALQSQVDRMADPKGYEARQAEAARDAAIKEAEAGRNVDRSDVATSVLSSYSEYAEIEDQHKKNMATIEAANMVRDADKRAREFENIRHEEQLRALESKHKTEIDAKYDDAVKKANEEADQKIKAANEEFGGNIRKLEEEFGERVDDVEDRMIPPTEPPPNDESDRTTPEEIEPDSVVLNGSAGRRNDSSIEWVKNEGVESVLRLFGWSQSSNKTYDVLGGVGPGQTDPDAGIQFLVRIPATGGNGYTLGYVTLTKHQSMDCDEGSES